MRRIGRPGATAAVVALAAAVRIWAALHLPVDVDEPIYLQDAAAYADLLQVGDLAGVVDHRGTPEHPPLVRLLYAFGFLALGDHFTGERGLLAGRSISALFGTLAVLVVALAGGPLAGGLLALHTLTAKYTSQVYLEAWPLFTSLSAVLAMERSRRARDRWFWLSAIALGATAAGKYSYFPVVFPIAYLAWTRRAKTGMRWRDALILGGVAMTCFLALDPALWRDPVERLAGSLTFHARYSQSDHVQQAGYPWYQPLVWISHSAPWHSDVFLYAGFDEVVFVLAAVGLVREWRTRRWLTVWIGAGLAFLLLWPTKWPQYVLVLTPPLCLAAGGSAEQAAAWLRRRLPRAPTRD
jgi:hypothetical protein